jgi:hypothetical protein
MLLKVLLESFNLYSTSGYFIIILIIIGILNPSVLRMLILSYIISKLDITLLKNNNLLYFIS